MGEAPTCESPAGMITERSEDPAGTSGEDGQRRHAEGLPPASGTAALARQLAQAKLSEAELQQRLRYTFSCRALLMIRPYPITLVRLV